MLLRFRGPDGTVRITVEPNDNFGQVGEKVSSDTLLSFWLRSIMLTYRSS